MHQVVVSSADQANGADLGIRQEWVPLFDEYGVDLVVCGHEHHYERSHPIRGQQPNQTLTPIPTSTNADVVDTSKGTVHMVIGGGGTSVGSNGVLFNPPACRVITAVGAPDPTTGKRPPVYVREDAPWLHRRPRRRPRSLHHHARHVLRRPRPRRRTLTLRILHPPPPPQRLKLTTHRARTGRAGRPPPGRLVDHWSTGRPARTRRGLTLDRRWSARLWRGYGETTR